MAHHITSDLKKVKDLLDNKDQFIIPDFQRGFVWQRMKLIHYSIRD